MGVAITEGLVPDKFDSNSKIGFKMLEVVIEGVGTGRDHCMYITTRVIAILLAYSVCSSLLG